MNMTKLNADVRTGAFENWMIDSYWRAESSHISACPVFALDTEKKQTDKQINKKTHVGQVFFMMQVAVALSLWVYRYVSVCEVGMHVHRSNW